MIRKVHGTSSSDGQTASEAGSPIILLMDTCGAVGSVALARLGGAPAILATRELPGRSSSERLLPAIDALLAEQRSAPPRLQAVAVVHGPGSFTGVRVGLSAAKGLCESLSIPLLAISRLAVLASKATLPPGATGTVLAMLDAGRDELYAGEYRQEICVKESLRTAHEVAHLQDTGSCAAFVACEGTVVDRVGRTGTILVPELGAADALGISTSRMLARAFDDVSAIDANYVRRTPNEIFAKQSSRRS